MSVSLGKLFGIGCGDNSCIWGAKGGMATNGGCCCFEIGDRTGGLPVEELRRRMVVRSGIHLLRQLAELPQIAAALEAFAVKVREAK